MISWLPFDVTGAQTDSGTYGVMGRRFSPWLRVTSRRTAAS